MLPRVRGGPQKGHAHLRRIAAIVADPQGRAAIALRAEARGRQAAIAAQVMTDSEFLDREVPALASLLVGRYGERALAFASLQALKARAGNRPTLMEAWQRIGNAAHHILRAEPMVTAESRDHRVERLERRTPSWSDAESKRAEITSPRHAVGERELDAY